MSKVTLTRRLRGGQGHGGLVDVTVEMVMIHFVDDYGRTVSLSFDSDFDCVDKGNERIETYQVLSDCPVTWDLPTGKTEGSGPTARVIRELLNAMVDLRD